MAQITTVLPLLVILLVGQWRTRTIFSPSGVLLGTWCVFLTAHALFMPDYLFSSSAGFILVLLLGSFVMGETCGSVGHPQVRGGWPVVGTIESRRPSEPALRIAILGLGAISAVGSAIYLFIIYRYFGSFIGLFTAGWVIRGQLAEGMIEIPLMVRAMALTAYSTLILALVYWILFKFRWFLAVPLICTLTVGLAQAGRAGTLMMLITICVAAIWRDAGRSGKNPAYRAVRRVAGFSVLIVLIFVLGQRYRERDYESSLLGEAQVDTYKGYALGAISGFSVFWHSYSMESDRTFGAYSFASLFQLLGVRTFAAGYYDEYASISRSNDNYTNIYTLFRPAIEDYGAPGAAVYLFVWGFVMSRAFLLARSGNCAALAFIMMSYTFLVYSVFAPLTQHNTVIMAFTLPPIILYLMDGKNPGQLRARAA